MQPRQRSQGIMQQKTALSEAIAALAETYATKAELTNYATNETLKSYATKAELDSAFAWHEEE